MNISPDSKLVGEMLRTRQWPPPLESLRIAKQLESGERAIVTKALLDAYEAMAKAAKEDLVMRDDISAQVVDEALSQLEAARKVQ